MPAIAYRTADVDGVKVFYREAGPGPRRNSCRFTASRARATCSGISSRGSPTASTWSLPICRAWAFRYAGERTRFDQIAATIDRFTEPSASIATPLCLRLRRADRLPTRGQASGPDHRDLSQNGNAYEEGLSDGWSPIRAYWKDPSQPIASALRAFLKPETTIWQDTHGVPTRRSCRRTAIRSTISICLAAEPPTCNSTCSATTRAMSRSIRPSRTISATHKPPLLAAWAVMIPFSCRRAPRPSARHPDALVRFFDTGHFALETHAADIAADIRDFLPLLLLPPP